MLDDTTQPSAGPQAGDNKRASKRRINQKLEELGYFGFLSAMGLVIGNWYNFITPLTTLRAAVQFFPLWDANYNAMSNISIPIAPDVSYNNTMSSSEQDSVALSMTTVRGVAIGITTFYFVTLVGLAAAYGSARLAYTSCCEKKLSRETEDLTQEGALEKLRNEATTRAALVNIPPARRNAVSQYFIDMNTFSRRAGSWATKFSILGFVSGYAFTLKAYYQSNVASKVPPPFGLLTADFSDASTMLFQFGYAWTAWFSSRIIAFSALMFGYHFYRLVQALRGKPVKIEAPTEEGANPQTSVSYSSFLLCAGLTLLPFYLSYAVPRAWDYGNYLAASNQCFDAEGNPSAARVFNDLMNFRYPSEDPNSTSSDICFGAQHLNVIAGTLSYLEIGMLWSGLGLLLLATLSVGIITKCRKNEANPDSYAARFTRHVNASGKKALFILPWALIAGGVIAFFPAEALTNNIAENGVSKIVSFDGIVGSATIAPACNTSANQMLWHTSLPGLQTDCNPITVAQMCAAWVSAYWSWEPTCAALMVGLAFYVYLLAPFCKKTLDAAAGDEENPTTEADSDSDDEEDKRCCGLFDCKNDSNSEPFLIGSRETASYS